MFLRVFNLDKARILHEVSIRRKETNAMVVVLAKNAKHQIASRRLISSSEKWWRLFCFSSAILDFKNLVMSFRTSSLRLVLLISATWKSRSLKVSIFR